MMLKKRVVTAALAAALSLMIASPAQAGWEVLKPANAWEKIKKQVAKQEISGSLTLVNADIIDGISTSLRYKIESEPSYVDGYYTRIDKYIMDFGVDIGDLINDMDSPVSFGINKGTEIIFARQFKNQKDSLLTLPYTMRNLPLTAEKAITRLVPGDFVAFEGKISLILSLGYDTLKGSFEAGASTHAYLSGNFMVHLFRMADNKMRVKLIAVRGEGVGANAGVEVEDLEVLGVNLIDNRIEKWLNFVPLKASAGLGKNDVIMLDYVFDLDNAQAAQAYDGLMQNKVMFKDVKILNPLASRKDLQNQLLADLTDVEAITMEDAQAPAQQRRIDRVFKGSSEGVFRDAKTKFSLSLLKFEAGRAYGENKVLSFDKKDQERHFLLDTFSKYKKSKILFGLFGEETLATSNLLFTSNSRWAPQRFVTLTSSNEMKMRDVSPRDFREIQKIVQETIGLQEYNKVPWHLWTFENGKIVNGYFKQEVFFNPDALAYLPYMTKEAFVAKFKAYIATKSRPRSTPIIGGLIPPKGAIGNWMAAFTGDIKRIAERLQIIINPATTVEKRFEAFEDLQEIGIWRERGVGFLMSLVPETSQHQLMRYEMVLSAKGTTPIQYSFGTFAEESLYRSLMYIQNIIHNRSFDLRLFSDDAGEYRTHTKPAPLM
ncbi:hypothetical protein [Bdellovibrio bacteriovorus]|uniref:Uncharacterized protein n=1 Tax=Bdellovibrio bacteriovorus str. Tiberius TaxID=1069642 RepID=K7YSW2_BDEBC|nr:hypothetical protein [Bdellovibrio bacteriovorus]AFY02951.1 hypothetical protein Bdt_3276 [Bdellovibrio bacteriovorus str. Tiberius]